MMVFPKARTLAREPINRKKNKEADLLLKSDFTELVIKTVQETLEKQGIPVKRKEVFAYILYIS
jgi:hypothetical protein